MKSHKQNMDYSEETTENELIIINIRGTVITLWLEDISKKEHFMKVILPFYNSATKQYVLQRNPSVIHNILDYFCGRKFHLPKGFCMTMTEDELKFWNISPSELEYCCLSKFTKQRENDKTKNMICQNWQLSHFPAQARADSVRYKLWRFLEQPSSSKFSLCWAILISFACVVSIGVLCVESILIQGEPIQGHFLAIFNGTKTPLVNIRTYFGQQPNSNYSPYQVMDTLDKTMTSLMTIEVILRIIVAYNRRIFLSSLFTICDILFIVFTWASFLWVYIQYRSELSSIEVKALSAILVLSRLLRIPRLFYAVRHSKGLLILAWSVRASLKDIAFLTILVLIIVSGFGILIFYAEQGSEEFPDVFSGMWWALVTITTVGYGDKYPTTIAGFLVGVCCAWVGVLTITLTVPIFATHFSNYFEHFNALYRMHAYKKSKLGERKSIKANLSATTSQSSIEESQTTTENTSET